jgi:uncharacterized protein GlcG (DUF336 family)
MVPRLRYISYQGALCLLTTGKYWKMVRTVVYAVGVGGKKSAMDGRDAHEVDRAVPMVRRMKSRMRRL